MDYLSGSRSGPLKSTGSRVLSFQIFDTYPVIEGTETWFEEYRKRRKNSSRIRNRFSSPSRSRIRRRKYRLSPEHHLPVVYDDWWEAIQWATSHSRGDGNETWLRDHADFDKVFLAGDSAGANIVHNMAMRAMTVKFRGIILVHPYFWGEEMIGSESSNLDKKAMIDRLWVYVCPSTTGNDDSRINPVAVGAPSLSNLGCSRVLIFVAEKDTLKNRGWHYYEALKKSGWGGTVELIETEVEDHVFHLFYPTTDKAIGKMKTLASLMNQEA